MFCYLRDNWFVMKKKGKENVIHVTNLYINNNATCVENTEDRTSQEEETRGSREHPIEHWNSCKIRSKPNTRKQVVVKENRESTSIWLRLFHKQSQQGFYTVYGVDGNITPQLLIKIPLPETSSQLINHFALMQSYKLREYWHQLKI